METANLVNGQDRAIHSYGSVPSTGENWQTSVGRINLARTAYGERDTKLSRLVHQQRAVEGHRVNGDFIKSIIYGGLDGVLTAFALISGAAGGRLGTEVVLILGVSNIVADAFSMGVGDAVSTIAYNEHVKHERLRECWEFDNYPEGEVEEMIDLYENRGLPRDKAKIVIETMAKYRELFIDVMMTEELGLQVPDEDESPAKEGLITFASFLVFGFIPLIGYIIFPILYDDLSDSFLFSVACAVTVCLLFALGAFKSRFSSKSWWKSGLEYLFLGSLAASSSYTVGVLVENLGREWFASQATP